MRRSRGLSLGGVMVASLVLAVLALGLARLSVSHLWLSSRSNQSLQASSLVNSAASAAMAKLMEKRTYGASDPDILLESGQGRAVVTFSAPRARDLSVPFSTNNLDGTVPTDGFGGRQVQPGTALVIATCEHGGSRRTVEAVLKLPPFPWAIVAGGTLQTRERVLIGAIPAGQWPPPPDEELLPADILANASSERSIVLEDECIVMGDVESPGGIVLEGGNVTVRGEIRPGSDPIEVPQLHAAQYDPRTLNIAFDGLESIDPTADVIPVQGAARKQGDLEINGLRLEGGLLYVEGDLTIAGTVTGRGTLVCSGDIDIQGMQLDSATDLAVLADGEIKLRGSGQMASAVKGLFYAGEGLLAKDLTVVGTVVAGRSFGQVELENARVVSQMDPPEAEQVSDTAYVGRIVPGQFGRDGLPLASLDRIDRQLPTDQYGFSIRVVRPNPEATYPCTVTIGPGFVTPLTRSFTLRGPGDHVNVYNLFANEFQGGVLDRPRTVYLEVGVRSFFNNLINSAVAPGGLAESGTIAVNLEGDLSRFLPFEERLRVISWVER